jgi:hypothetical protein
VDLKNKAEFWQWEKTEIEKNPAWVEWTRSEGTSGIIACILDEASEIFAMSWRLC